MRQYRIKARIFKWKRVHAGMEEFHIDQPTVAGFLAPSVQLAVFHVNTHYRSLAGKSGEAETNSAGAAPAVQDSHVRLDERDNERGLADSLSPRQRSQDQGVVSAGIALMLLNGAAHDSGTGGNSSSRLSVNR
jgi:hypothetical protein